MAEEDSTAGVINLPSNYANPFAVSPSGIFHCVGCKGSHKEWKDDLTMDKRCVDHAREWPGCKWLHNTVGFHFVITQLSSIGFQSAVQVMNFQTKHSYSGDNTELMMIMAAASLPLLHNLPMSKYKHMSVLEHRSASFTTAGDSLPRITHEELAKAGMFYSDEGLITCFWCGGQPRDLSILGAQNIWTFHALEYYGCPKVAIIKGLEFVSVHFNTAEDHIRELAWRTFDINKQHDHKCTEKEFVFSSSIAGFVDGVDMQCVAASGGSVSEIAVPGQFVQAARDNEETRLQCRVNGCTNKFKFIHWCKCFVCNTHADHNRCLSCAKERTSLNHLKEDDSQPWLLEVKLEYIW